jgi:alcohol dehydrogenase class IV
MPKIEFGNGIVGRVGEIAEALATARFDHRSVPGSERVGERIEASLSAAGVRVVSARIEPNPSCFAVDRAALQAREAGCSVVVAAGGGSRRRFGKACPLFALNPGNSWI